MHVKTGPIRLKLYTTIIVAAGLCFGADVRAEKGTVERPNFLVIVADDLGYSDLGAFGGEIETPHLDRLAMQGLRLTNFHTGPTCSPTRSMLLTGVDHHKAGIGAMAEMLSPEVRGKPGYEGHLNDRVVTVATLLKDAGYATMMTGKWHLGLKQEQGPAARGFEKSFAMLEGGASHLDMKPYMPMYGPKALYREDGRKVDQLPDDFYSTDFYTDRMISYISDSQEDGGKPFFAYLAYTAPHWPLQAPDHLINKYKGRYDQGPLALRTARLARMKKLGLIPENTEAHPLVQPAPEWDSLSPEHKAREARKMEVYAAMVDSIDQNVGRLLAALERKGELDNTIIVFLSDNGAEGMDLNFPPEVKAKLPPPMQDVVTWIENSFDHSTENIGRQNSYVFSGPYWAQAQTAPFRAYKAYTAEGGIRTPAFIWSPKLKRQGAQADQFVSVKDIVPTLLDMADVRHPLIRYKGREIYAPEGTSLQPYLNRKSSSVQRPNDMTGFELWGRKGLISGDWKIVNLLPPFGTGEWQLYNLANDMGEIHDLATARPEELKRMLKLWDQYQKSSGVVPVVPR